VLTQLELLQVFLAGSAGLAAESRLGAGRGVDGQVIVGDIENHRLYAG
jgi:hypothetical protein